MKWRFYTDIVCYWICIIVCASPNETKTYTKNYNSVIPNYDTINCIYANWTTCISNPLSYHIACYVITFWANLEKKKEK